MARLDFEEFGDEVEVTCVYIAGRLEEAKRVETILTRHGIDYAVDMEVYFKPVFALLSLCAYAGVGFFVLSAQAAFARRELLAAGLKAGIGDDNDY
jgi:hypothetical protein